MQFSMKTKSLKKNTRLTLVVDGPKDFIEQVETSIHSILAFPKEPVMIKTDAGRTVKHSVPDKRLPGPLLQLDDNDEATVSPEELAAAKASIKPSSVAGGRFEPIDPDELKKLTLS